MTNNAIIAFSIGVTVVVIIVIVAVLISKESFAPTRIGVTVPTDKTQRESLRAQVTETLEEELSEQPTEKQVQQTIKQVQQVQQSINEQLPEVAQQERINTQDLIDEMNSQPSQQLKQVIQQVAQQQVAQQSQLSKQQIKQVAQQQLRQHVQQIQAQQPTQQKENFFALGDRAYVDEQGDIGGSRIMTNGLLNQPYEEIKAAIQDNKPLKDNSTLGVARGDDLETAYSAYKAIQDVQENDPTAVRSSKEMADIAKQISAAQNNASSNILTRAGSSKAKIKMDPLGTVGVCDQYTTPERDRNHKIYSVAHAVHVPGFEIDTNRINQELTASPGWSKNFATNTISAISTAGTMEGAAKQAQKGGIVQSESFSSRSYVSY